MTCRRGHATPRNTADSLAGLQETTVWAALGRTFPHESIRIKINVRRNPAPEMPALVVVDNSICRPRPRKAETGLPSDPRSFSNRHLEYPELKEILLADHDYVDVLLCPQSSLPRYSPQKPELGIHPDHSAPSTWVGHCIGSSGDAAYVCSSEKADTVHNEAGKPDSIPPEVLTLRYPLVPYIPTSPTLGT